MRRRDDGVYTGCPARPNHRLRHLDAVPLNETHFALEVNFLEYWER